MIYLDTSAAMKLVRPEQYSIELSSWLELRREMPVLSSILIAIELPRATRRVDPDRLPYAQAVLDGIGTVGLSPWVVARATGYAEPDLRSLDAIHLATAERVGSASGERLQAIVAYDDRLLAAARATGLPTASPGRD